MAFVKTLSRALVTVLRTSVNPHTSKPLQFSLQRCSLSTTTPLASLEEFFEVEKHRGERTIRVGREWRKDELRLKSNEDLHKLWFVLLKERNMLLTMEEAYKDAFAAMPNPERLDKVELSMEHLEEVVRERNRAFWQLEVGVSGERERTFRKDFTGRMVPYKPREHGIPYWMNTSYRKKLAFKFQNNAREDVQDFKARLIEREGWIEQRMKNIQLRLAARVLRRYPNCDLDALQEKFPHVEMEKLLRWKKIIGETFTTRDV